MRPKPIHYYVGLICGLAVVSLHLVPWETLRAFPADDVLGLLLLMAFGLLSERLSVGMTFVPRGASHTITFLPLLATVLLFGPAASVLLMTVTGGVAEVFIRKKEPIRAVFNLAQYLLSTCTAAWVYANLGGIAGANLGAFIFQLIPFFAFLFTFMGINHIAVTLAIAISQVQPFQEVWGKFIGPWGIKAIYDALVSPLAIVVAFFYSEAGWVGLLISLLPLLFIRHAYLNNYRLEQANRDLLRALVKAIETRDPYTSGHSQRVAWLAGRIARGLNLGVQRVEAVEMAALLHDVGKIDAVYSEILRKPDGLSAEERRMMESHVIKGVELLRSLASVPEEVITAVRHHHEREDGRGYPDGIAGDQIPLGAKIIKVCDAVDAMLSDRPYRPALYLERVKEELTEHAGRDFDPNVALWLVRSSLLEEHLEKVESSGPPAADGARTPRQTRTPRHWGASTPAARLG